MNFSLTKEQLTNLFEISERCEKLLVREYKDIRNSSSDKVCNDRITELIDFVTAGTTYVLDSYIFKIKLLSKCTPTVTIDFCAKENKINFNASLRGLNDDFNKLITITHCTISDDTNTKSPTFNVDCIEQRKKYLTESVTSKYFGIVPVPYSRLFPWKIVDEGKVKAYFVFYGKNLLSCTPEKFAPESFEVEKDEYERVTTLLHEFENNPNDFRIKDQ